MRNVSPGFGALAAATLAAVLYALISDDTYMVKLVVWIATNALLGAGLRFVLLIGEVNLATAAFFGIGAYVAAVLTTMAQMPLAVALLAGPLVAAVLAALFGWVTLRTRGPYFLLISFAFTEIVRLIYTRVTAIGGNSGIVGIFPPLDVEPYFPAIIIALVGATLMLLYLAEESHLGRLFKGIRNNENILRSVGINVLRIKVLCLVLASAAVGLGGALHAHSSNVISPGDFSFFVAVFALAYVKIGGERHIFGAVLGAALLTVLSQVFIGYGTQEHVFYGAAIIFAMLVLPNGLLGSVERVWSALRAAASGRRAGGRVDAAKRPAGEEVS